MLRIRPAKERGHAEHGWLESQHTFSFASYYDPNHMGFRTLRVINDDTVQPGQGFGTHGHDNMEIVSYVVEGALEHRDSMGTGSVLRQGDVQRMSAGTGVTHSEFNHSRSDPLRFLQIWILPAKRDLAPGYEEKHFDVDTKKGRLCLIVSPDGHEGSLRIHQDVRIYASLLERGDEVEHTLARSRHAWVQVVDGSVQGNGMRLDKGDGLAVNDEHDLRFVGNGPCEFLLFDLN